MSMLHPSSRWALLLWFAPALLSAQTPYVAIEQRLTAQQLHATGLDTLTPSQLQLLNQLLSEDARPVSAVEAPGSIPEDSAAAPAAATPPSHATVNSQTAAPEPTKAPMFIGLNDEPVKSKVRGTITGWEPGSEFLLENGQRWKVLKGALKLPKPMDNPSITVIPGIAGRWFLQVDENLPSARVYRIE